MRQELIEPIRGLMTSTAPQNIDPGTSAFCQNYDIDDRTLRLRSGLSQWGTSGFLDKALGAVRFNDQLGTDYTVLVSDKTSSVRSEGAVGWSTLTSTPDSSASTGYKDFAYGYAPSLDENILIMMDGIAAPMYWSPILSAWTALGDFGSHESFVRFGAFFDNRAVLFNMGGSRTSLPFATRVRWSQRGDPLEYTDQDAGFEDLADMRGAGTGVHAEADRLVLFSEEETWIARSRRDQYAFDFTPLSREVGCPYPRSAAKTDKGIIWLDANFRFRLISGNAVYTFNDDTQKFLVDTLREPTEMWSRFDPNESQYYFNFSDTTGQYPSRALWLRTDTITADPRNPNELRGAWLHQDFPIQTSAGVEEVLVSSTGTAYRLLSAQTNDNGTAIDARWRAHGMRISRDPDMKESLTGAWLDYQAESTSSVSLYASQDLGGTFTHLGAFSCVSGNNTAFLPMTTPAARFQQIELRQIDGAQPRIVNLRLELRQWTGRF